MFGLKNQAFGFLMTIAEEALDSSRAVCPVCRAAILLEEPSAQVPTRCAHCRACGRWVLAAFLLPVALWLVGIPFEGRHDSAHRLYGTAASRLYDRALLAFLAADLAFGLWLVWYAAGMRRRALFLAVVQFVLCVVVLGDFLWSAGPP